MGISGSLISVEFGGVPGLVESSKILRCEVDINRNLKLINLSEFFKF